ncbi:unnamed protein product [Ectocarpus sp. 12 AP-2014]
MGRESIARVVGVSLCSPSVQHATHRAVAAGRWSRIRPGSSYGLKPPRLLRNPSIVALGISNDKECVLRCSPLPLSMPNDSPLSCHMLPWAKLGSTALSTLNVSFSDLTVVRP